MLSLKMKSLKGLNTIFSTSNEEDIFQIFSRYFLKVFYNSFLDNFEKFTIKYMRQIIFVKITSLTLLKMLSHRCFSVNIAIF